MENCIQVSFRGIQRCLTTTRYVPGGTRLLEYEGELIRGDDELSRRGLQPSRFIFPFDFEGTQYYINATKNSGLGKLVGNYHIGNVIARGEEIDGEVKLFFYSVDDMPPSSTLLFNHGTRWNELNSAAATRDAAGIELVVLPEGAPNPILPDGAPNASGFRRCAFPGCGVLQEGLIELGQHWAATHTDAGVCWYCGATLASSAARDEHLAMHRAPISRRSRRTLGLTCKCEPPIEFVSATHYRLHMTTYHKELVFPCDQCSYISTSTSNALRLHVINKHQESTEKLTKKCPYCQECFVAGKSFLAHKMKEHIEEFRYDCVFCAKKFDAKQLLYVHKSQNCRKRKLLAQDPSLFWSSWKADLLRYANNDAFRREHNLLTCDAILAASSRSAEEKNEFIKVQFVTR